MNHGRIVGKAYNMRLRLEGSVSTLCCVGGCGTHLNIGL